MTTPEMFPDGTCRGCGCDTGGKMPCAPTCPIDGEYPPLDVMCRSLGMDPATTTEAVALAAYDAMCRVEDRRIAGAELEMGR